MNKGDLSSTSETTKKKQKLDDDKEKVGGGNADSSPREEQEEEEKRRYRSLAQVSIAIGINPCCEKSAISDLVKMSCPSFSPDNSKLKKTVLELHEEGKENVKKLMKDSQGKLTLSFEWIVLGGLASECIEEDSILYDDFIVITAYFADENFKMKKWILGYHPRESLRVKDIYVDPFKNVIADYEIESKVGGLLVPNYGDLGVKAFDDFRKWIEERGKKENLNPIDPRVFLIYCCSDIFRLMVDDISMDIGIGLMERARMLVSWGRMTPTNWNITLYKLQKAVDMEAKKAFAEDEDYDDYDKLSDEEWIKIKTFCKLVGCIYKVAKELFEVDQYPTSNVYFHLLAELKFMLNEELKNGDNDYFLEKAKKMLERFDKYWSDMFLVLATASVLDPRFKMKYLELYCSKWEASGESSKLQTVSDYLRSLYSRYAASDVRRQPERVDDAVEGPKYYFEDEEEETEEEEKTDAYEEFVMFQEFLKFEGSSSSREFQESELDCYFKEPVLEWDKEFNALKWWKEESQKYPILSRVARDILSIPISRGISLYSAYVADKREPPDFVVSMEPELVNAMMCSQSWPRD